jgi:DNA polymerase-3 subunit beta
MKIAANAGVLARALALAASLDVGKRPSAAALEAVNMIAGDGAVTIVRSVLDHQISLTVPATIELSGAMAVPNDRLAKLVVGFPAKAELTIEADAPAAKVRSGRSRYTLPIVPSGDLPLALSVATDASRVELSRGQALALFATGFCVAHDARTYLCGLYIADSDTGLVGVATNGYTLARRVLHDTTGWGGGVIVPTAAIKVVNKLLADRSVERVTLRHSGSLLAYETPQAAFVSRLIDATFPDYARIIPKPAVSVATVERDALVKAVARFAAIGGRTVQLSWADGALRLTDGGAEDLIDAETTGGGKVALAVDRLAALLDEFTGTTVNLDVTDGTPVRITDRDDADFVVVLAPTAVPSGGAS